MYFNGKNNLVFFEIVLQNVRDFSLSVSVTWESVTWDHYAERQE